MFQFTSTHVEVVRMDGTVLSRHREFRDAWDFAASWKAQNPNEELVIVTPRTRMFAQAEGSVVEPTAYDSRYGVVHVDLEDENLRGVWSKTTTWHTIPAEYWKDEMDAIRARGFQELPIIVDGSWETPNDRMISNEELATLRRDMAPHLLADPLTNIWELGIEENLKDNDRRFELPFYFQNLRRKADLAREIAPDFRFCFQIVAAGADDLRNIEQFLQSEAAAAFDILSLHPYMWPNFPMPELWLADFIRAVRERTDKAIWFTEVGAPHHAAPPGEFFGYPPNNVVQGLTQEDLITYMQQIHEIGFSEGVEKIFWYNYRDGGNSINFPEHHFGLVDYDGDPKPVYQAYVDMIKSTTASRTANA